jgi:hypothetical protein
MVASSLTCFPRNGYPTRDAGIQATGTTKAKATSKQSKATKELNRNVITASEALFVMTDATHPTLMNA